MENILDVIRKKKQLYRIILMGASLFLSAILYNVFLLPLSLVIHPIFLAVYILYYGYRAFKEELGPFLMPLVIVVLSLILTLKLPKFIVIIPFAYVTYKLIAQPIILKQRIADEDKIIDEYFIDLYLLMFSKLRQGSRARLQTTLDNYIYTLESQAETEETRVMKKFARYFLNLVALYEDHMAIPKLRELYRNATVINFCNVAAQAMQGIDNLDNLISFKMQLVERKAVAMRKRAAYLLAAGNRSIFAIWIILFIFIIVGWVSKLPTGFF